MDFKVLKEEFTLLWQFYLMFILIGLMAGITAPVYILFYLNAGL